MKSQVDRDVNAKIAQRAEHTTSAEGQEMDKVAGQFRGKALLFPVQGILASPTAGGFTLALPIIIAIAAYVLLHFATKGLLRLIAHRKTEI